MKIWTQPLGPLETNAYVLSNEQNKGIVIDPGMDPDPMLDAIQNIHIEAILLTHAHFDHIGGLERVREATGAPVYLHELEKEWLMDPDKNGSERWLMVTEPIQCRPRDHGLEGGQTLQLADLTIAVLHTPGHSPGSVSFYVEEENLILAGDTLFAGSIGRTDLYGGDHKTLMESIKKKILTLPDETIVYPGHGQETTVGDEQTYNPFLNRG